MVELQDAIIVRSCCCFISLKAGALAVLFAYIMYHLAILGMAFTATEDAAIVISLTYHKILFLFVEGSMKLVYLIVGLGQVAVNAVGVYAVIAEERNFFLPAAALNAFLLGYTLLAMFVFAILQYHLPYGVLIAVYESEIPGIFETVIDKVKHLLVTLWIGTLLGLASDIAKYVLQSVSLPWYCLANIILFAVMYHFFTVIYSYYSEMEDNEIREADEYEMSGGFDEVVIQ